MCKKQQQQQKFMSRTNNKSKWRWNEISLDWHRCQMSNGHSTFRCVFFISFLCIYFSQPIFAVLRHCCCVPMPMRKYEREIPNTEIQCSLLLLTYYRFLCHWSCTEVEHFSPFQHFNISSLQHLYIFKRFMHLREPMDVFF